MGPLYTPPYTIGLMHAPPLWGIPLGYPVPIALGMGTGGYRGVYKPPLYLYANLTHTLICSLAMCIIGGNEKYVQIRKMHCMRSPVSLFRYQRANSQPRYGRFRRTLGLQLFQLRVGSAPLKPGSVGAWRRRDARLNSP